MIRTAESTSTSMTTQKARMTPSTSRKRKQSEQPISNTKKARTTQPPDLLTSLANQTGTYIFERILSCLDTRSMKNLSQANSTLRIRTNDILTYRKNYEFGVVNYDETTDFEKLTRRGDKYGSPSAVNKITNDIAQTWLNGEIGRVKIKKKRVSTT